LSGQLICGTDRWPHFLELAPNVSRTVEELHRFIGLGHLLEHSGVVRFAVQRFLQASQGVCRITPIAQLNAFTQ
jgi:hypothetical protein